MAVVKAYCDFGAQENKICQCSHFASIYLPLNAGTECHDLSSLNAEFLRQHFPFLFHPHQEAL